MTTRQWRPSRGGLRTRWHGRRGRRATRGEDGSISIELLFLVPVLLACTLAIAAGGRYVDARGQTSAAAYAAARAASLTREQAAAVAAGREAAARSMSDRGKSCIRMTVTIDADGFRPGGQVTATVTCSTDLTDLGGIGLPATKTFEARAVVTVEEHRVL